MVRRPRALRNREWSTGKPVSAAQFREALKLQSLCIYGDRSAELTFGAGKLFRGHSITVSLGARGKPNDATI